MSNTSTILSTPMTSLDDPIVPAGTWTGKIKGGKLGEPKVSERSGDEYRRASIAIQLVEPGHDVDAAEAAAGNFVGETVFFEAYLKSDRDAKQLLRTLKSLGAEIEMGKAADQTVEETLKTIRGLTVYAEVSNEMYNNRVQTKVKKIYAQAA